MRYVGTESKVVDDLKASSGDGEQDYDGKHQMQGRGENESSFLFVIDSDEAANWLVRRVVESRAYGYRVQRWAERETGRAERDEAFFLGQYGRQLRSWLDQCLAAAGGRRRSVDLPAGRVGLRKRSLRVEVTDTQKAAAWCSQNAPHAAELRIRVCGPVAFEMAEQVALLWPEASLHWSIGRSDLAKHLKTSGEVPEGTRIGEPSDELYVR
jgi:hypothetical protein